MEQLPKSDELKTQETVKEYIKPVQEKPSILKSEDIEEQRIKSEEERNAKVEQLREKISELNESGRESLVEGIRLQEKYASKPVELEEQDRVLVLDTSNKIETKLAGNYEPNFGISPCSDPNENFYDQIWSRDGAHAVGNYYGEVNPAAVRDSLETTFRHQKEDGQLPLRVERVEMPLRLIPVIGVWLSKAVFKLHVREKDGRRERGIYRGQDLSGGEDTVPATIIAIGEFFLKSKEGKEFAVEHYKQLKKAIAHFRTKVDKEDGLAVVGKSPDWAETIRREGKLSTVNVWWARALRLMEFMSKQLGHEEDADQFREDFRKVKESILEKLYDKEGAYFRTGEGEDRIDTVGSVFGALYLLSPTEAARVEETLSKRVKHSSGLVNFDPPYPNHKVYWVPRIFGNGDYHNKFVWPWVTCENIQVKIKVALQHPDETVREQYKREAIEDLIAVSKLFKDAGGAYEIVKPDEPKPPKGIYSPPKNLMGSLAAYQGAYGQLKKLGWI